MICTVHWLNYDLSISKCNYSSFLYIFVYECVFTYIRALVYVYVFDSPEKRNLPALKRFTIVYLFVVVIRDSSSSPGQHSHGQNSFVKPASKSASNVRLIPHSLYRARQIRSFSSIKDFCPSLYMHSLTSKMHCVTTEITLIWRTAISWRENVIQEMRAELFNTLVW